MIEDWLVGIVVVLVTKMLNSSIDQKDAGSEIFDLSTANSQVLNGQTAGDFNITFHTSQNDADMNTGSLATMYASSTTTPETIFIRIEAIANPESADFTSFTLTVSEQPTAGIGIDVVGCDDISNDGFEEFDFSTQDASIYSGYPAMNAGLDPILDVANFVTDANPVAKVARSLVKFDQSQIDNVIDSIAKITGSWDNWSGSLKLNVAKALIKSGADINEVNWKNKQRSALDYAVFYKH
jgi:hypothetical protein